MRRIPLIYVPLCGCRLLKKELKEKGGTVKSGNLSRTLICPIHSKEIDYKIATCTICGEEIKISKTATSPLVCKNCKEPEEKTIISPTKGNVRECSNYHLCTPYCVHPFPCNMFVSNNAA